jgi:hypothetical protein
LLEGKLIELVPLDEVFLNVGDDLDHEERAALQESNRDRREGGHLRPMSSWMSAKSSLNGSK